MQPFIYIGPLPLPTYGLITISGFIVGILVAISRSKTYNYPKDYVFFASLFAGIGLVGGAKLLYFLTSLPSFIRDYDLIAENNMDGLFVMQYLFGGFVFYGGFIGAFIMIKIFCKIYNLNFLKLINIITPAVPLIHGIGRIGCFFGGCCYGIEYHGFGAIHFKYNELTPELSLVPRFPVQLVESALNIILFVFLYIYSRKPRKDGSIMGIYLICYTIIRFSLEFLRGDKVRGFVLGISTSQWISLLLIPIGIYLLLRKDKSTNTANI